MCIRDSGGLASYPSSVLMNAIPAKVAGVNKITMVTPTPSGKINPLVLYAAKILGINKIIKIGGAQAIAALTYGTESIEAVDKIVGPGNSFVAAAKRKLFGQVGIDSVAGPSEVLIIADNDQNALWIASDLLAQSEHDENAKSILITDSLKFAKTMNEFVNYVYDFYGKNGIYDMGATRDNITTATIDYLASDDSLPFYGDSLDRERVRDILTSKFNLKEVI